MDGDHDLLRAWQAGDDRAGEQLFRRHYQLILRFFHNKAGTSAHDLVQRTFLACLEARDRIRGDASFRAFLCGVARNVLFDHYRLARRDRDHLDFGSVSVEDLRPTPGTLLAHAREVDLLLRALRTLPLEGQIILEMYYWEGMRAHEIGDALEMPEPTVRTKIRRARLRLEQIIQASTAPPAIRESTIEGLATWAQRIRDGIGT
ncbi:sigma-70 family RNA polymerase sigma factor [Nannocystis sp.]|uniref:RNA polymerase sigma factor n=1 Tax=Nannocystis sp. TaxID=1962667 RepID=UPI0025F41127|nr:sigma-70 family RNA polymerase sigma factor [Nannocystis sp.]